MEIDIKAKIALEKDKSSIYSSYSNHTISKIQSKNKVWVRSISLRQSLWRLRHRFFKKHCSQLLLFHKIAKKSKHYQRQVKLHKTNSIRASPKILPPTINKPLQKRPRKILRARHRQPELHKKSPWLKPLVEEIIPKNIIQR